MVVPFAAGGPVDTLGRILSPYLSQAIGRQVVIENISGAGGMNGSLRESQAAPDGHMSFSQRRDACAQSDALQEAALQPATDFARWR